MSSTQDITTECKYPGCNETGYHGHFHHGKYCSNECETKHEGREALARFKYNHTICFTCFRELKEIEPPKPDFEFVERGHGWTRNADGEITLQFYNQEVTREAACGFEHPTRYADTGEKERPNQIITGTICGHCGNTDHTDHYPLLAGRASIGRLVALLNGKDDVAFDIETLHRVYEATEAIDLAVGEALYD